MYANINGIKYYFVDEGKGSAIIFIHGLGENADSWKHQLNYFKKSFRVIAPDLRGHHRTEDGNVSDITLYQFSEDIIALLDLLKVDKAHFVGLSMGGIILQEITIKYQNRIITLSICNSTAYASQEALAGLNERLNMIKNVSMDDMANFIVTACLPAKHDPNVYKEAFEIFSKNRKEAYTASTKATFSVDFRDHLKHINLPTFVLCGENDIATPVFAGKYIHDNIKNSTMNIIPGVGHLSKLEAPKLFNEAIAEFLLPFEAEAVKSLLN
jgi:3-oxoadipate enol-lactonase